MPFKWTFGKHVIASLVVAAISLASQWLLGLFSTAMVRQAVNNNGSIAIIGGADGPTSIFVAGGGPSVGGAFLPTMLFLALLIALYVPLKLIIHAWGNRRGKQER